MVRICEQCDVTKFNLFGTINQLSTPYCRRHAPLTCSNRIQVFYLEINFVKNVAYFWSHQTVNTCTSNAIGSITNVYSVPRQLMLCPTAINRRFSPAEGRNISILSRLNICCYSRNNDNDNNNHNKLITIDCGCEAVSVCLCPCSFVSVRLCPYVRACDGRLAWRHSNVITVTSWWRRHHSHSSVTYHQ